MRKVSEIKEEIAKVEKARKAAKVKKARCNERLKALKEELKAAENKNE